MTAWLALVEARPAGATAAAAVTGDAGGWLAVWEQDEPPVPHALQADPAAFDPHGPPAVASYVLVEAPRTVRFDDLLVQWARRQLLAGGPWRTVTTLISDGSHFRGSLVAGPGDDPFARIAPARRLRVEPGLLSAGPAQLPAPVIERYAGQPWPVTRWSGTAG